MENITPGIGSRIKHPEYGTGVIIQVYADSYEITFIDYGTKQIMKSFDKLEVLDYVGSETDLLSFEKVERIFTRIIRRYSDLQETVDIAKKWRGGRIILEPGTVGLQGKDMPIDTFFHKIVMVRDRLRVMEQKVNASKLTEDEKVDLQQYITRIYGSLTTFNVLFAEKDDYFIGDKSN